MDAIARIIGSWCKFSRLQVFHLLSLSTARYSLALTIIYYVFRNVVNSIILLNFLFPYGCNGGNYLQERFEQ